MFARLLGFLLLLGACAQERVEVTPGAVEAHARVDQRKNAKNAQLLFARPLGSLNSREHFVLEAAFEEETSSLTLHSHFNGFDWRDGLQITLRRDGRKVALKWRGPDATEQSFDLPEGSLAEDGRLGLRLEIANSPVPRVLAWRMRADARGLADVARNQIAAATADFDSREHYSPLLKRGRGVRWGVETNGTRLIRLRREAPYVP